MKILAIEQEIAKIDWSKNQQLLTDEALKAYDLQQANIIREIYFTEKKNAVLVLECSSKIDAEHYLAELPLVKAGIITFEVFELRPYSGWSRILNIQ